MMSPCQKELIKVIGEILEAYPDYRLGQLVTNLPLLVGQGTADAASIIEDDVMLEAAKQHLEDLQARVAVAVDAAIP